MTIGYWRYYDDAFDWSDFGEYLRPDFDRSLAVFQENGMNKDVAQRHINSGYVCFDGFDVVIDRYYGGALSSFDFRCRFPSIDFRGLPSEPQSKVWVITAKSLNCVRSIVQERVRDSSGTLLFRGQTQNHTVQREINNPFFSIPGLGEISLLPSLWRQMLSKNSNSFLSFSNLTLFEWSNILYSQFDMENIERRHKKLHEEGEMLYTISDMEDCSDPVLREFGKYRLDLAFYKEERLAPLLATMLQHYGLLSPILDLTTSLETAIFFATHAFKKIGKCCSYEFVGSNQRRSLLYVFREHSAEMVRHNVEEEMIRNLDPLRPKRQDCVIAKSSNYALNLPADFLEGIILFDFDLGTGDICYSVPHLFPTEEEDPFLRALRRNPHARKHLTDFCLS